VIVPADSRLSAALHRFLQACIAGSDGAEVDVSEASPAFIVYGEQPVPANAAEQRAALLRSV